VAMGAYMPGNDQELDQALKAWPHIQTFLRQESDQVLSFEESLRNLISVTGISV